MFVIPVPYTFEFSRIKYPADIRLNMPYTIKDLDTLIRVNLYWNFPSEGSIQYKSLVEDRFSSFYESNEWRSYCFWGFDESCYFSKSEDEFLQYGGLCPLLDVVYPGACHYITGKKPKNENNPFLKFNYIKIK